jgi:predicted double-glycine peptidase
VLLLSLGGAALGWWCSKRPAAWWLAGYALPLLVIMIYGLGMHVPALALRIPFCWLLAGRTKFAIIGFLAALVLITPLSRINGKSTRWLILALLGLVIWRMSVWPFLAPAFNRAHLASLTTTIDADGVCLQSNEYCCGPAAAVTALRRLGLPAEEGEVALLAHTSTAIGTPPDMLAAALHRRYASAGLSVQHRAFGHLSELREAGLTLAVIRFSFMLDHYVAVLEVTETEVVMGDPLSGLRRMSQEEFTQAWRGHGVVLKRQVPRAERPEPTGL